MSKLNPFRFLYIILALFLLGLSQSAFSFDLFGACQKVSEKVNKAGIMNKPTKVEGGKVTPTQTKCAVKNHELHFQIFYSIDDDGRMKRASGKDIKNMAEAKARESFQNGPLCRNPIRRVALSLTKIEFIYQDTQGAPITSFTFGPKDCIPKDDYL